ncbi:MAG: metal ABC transporter permease [Clostridiaceae bacterium]|jgi:manganese/zinc/iron transport system permease protein|nr:metal ABC transporter permease [Bacillota bacterium]NLN51491.1 metal ABC transporter permease [Clostridiaceae bacterium]
MFSQILLFKISDILDYNQQMLITLLITGIACAILGCFLVLRKLSMITDALAHSILLGIVLAFLITKDLNSPILFIGAGLFGIFTVFSIELLSSTRLVKSDDAVGIIFPLFFSLAVILISTFARNVHLDIDIVLMGQVIMIPLNNIEILGIIIPKAMFYMLLMLVANTLLISIFFKELKISTFDPEFATIAGFSSSLLFYALMTLSSFTAVSAFDAVGAILVIALFIGPAASAYLLTKDLKMMLLVSILFSVANTFIGFFLAMKINVSISGMIAAITGATLLLTVLFNKDGIITAIYLRHKNKKEFRHDLLIMHLGNHQTEPDAELELGFDTIKDHLHWDQDAIERRTTRLIDQGLVFRDQTRKIYRLTEKGQLRYNMIKIDYGM